MTVKMYKLYAIDTYKGKGAKFIENKYKEYTLRNLLNELENNKGYHMRLHKDSSYILFGDCDGFNGPFSKFAKMLIDFLSQHYDIKIIAENISYTENKAKAGSFHYSVPRLFCTCEKLKEIHNNFYEKNKIVFNYKDTNSKMVRVVDTSIYTEKWFRYPKQSKEGNADVVHVIEKGVMKDFVVEYVPKDSVCIDNKRYYANGVGTKKSIWRMTKDVSSDDNDNSNSNNSSTHDTDTDSDSDSNSDNDNDGSNNSSLFNIVQIILSYVDEYDNAVHWTNIGMALKNMSNDDELFDLWDEWSKKSYKYDDTATSKRKWTSFYGKDDRRKKRDGREGFGIKYLFDLLKISNPDKYVELQKMYDVNDAVTQHKCNFPNNKCNVTELISTNNAFDLVVSDKHCPIYDGIHPDSTSYRYIRYTGKGIICMMCTDDECMGKCCPDGGIMAEKGVTNKIFMINYGTINNHYGNKKKIMVNTLIDKTVKIFDDSKLNELMIDTLCGSDSSIIDAMYYYYKDTICVVDDRWHKLEGFCWVEFTNISQVFTNFRKLYDSIKMYCESNIVGLKLNEAQHTINAIKDNLTTSTKLKDIIKSELTRKGPFDANRNLITFKNGVFDLDKLEFRKGRSDDMIKNTLSYDYVEEYSDEAGMMKTLNELIFDEDALKCFLLFITMSLCGKNDYDLMLLLYALNPDRNNLLFISDIIKNSFGDCCYYVDNLTHETNNFVLMQNARIIITKSIDKLAHEDAHQLVKNKIVSTSNGKKINIQSSVLWICGDMPKIDENANKYIGKIRLPNTCDIDYNINKMDFMLLLFEYIKTYKTHAASLNVREIMFKNNDTEKRFMVKNGDKSDGESMCKKFMQECTRRSNTHVTGVDVYNRYQLWAKDNHKEPLSRIKLFKEMKQHAEYSKTVRIGTHKTTGFIHLMVI